MNRYKKLINIFHQKIEGNRLKQFYMIQIHNIQKITNNSSDTLGGRNTLS